MSDKKYKLPETEPAMVSEPAVAISKPSVGYFWNIIKDTNNDTKVVLINLLAHSLATNTAHKAPNMRLASCFGSWKADMSSDDIMREVDAVCADKSDFINKYL